jgi:hypothetical protein
MPARGATGGVNHLLSDWSRQNHSRRSGSRWRGLYKTKRDRFPGLHNGTQISSGPLDANSEFWLRDYAHRTTPPGEGAAHGCRSIRNQKCRPDDWKVSQLGARHRSLHAFIPGARPPRCRPVFWMRLNETDLVFANEHRPPFGNVEVGYLTLDVARAVPNWINNFHVGGQPPCPFPAEGTGPNGSLSFWPRGLGARHPTPAVGQPTEAAACWITDFARSKC